MRRLIPNQHRTPLDRRELLKGVALAAAAGTLSYADEPTNGPAAEPTRGPASEDHRGEIVDTNVNLFQWPFRRLPGDTTEQLVETLRRLGIGQAWAGSFEGILHRDVAGVNARLAEACERAAPGLLVPFGTVNPGLPDWEEDLRRCHEEHRMPGIRLHPNYHGYTLADPLLERLLAMAAERALLVQLVVSMEDTRTQHPLLQVADVDLSPLPGQLKNRPQCKLQLLNHKVRGEMLARLTKSPHLYFDTARVEATDGIARLVHRVPLQRVLLGSHAPFFIPESALIKLDESQLSVAQCRAVCGLNAQRLLTLQPAA